MSWSQFLFYECFFFLYTIIMHNKLCLISRIKQIFVSNGKIFATINLILAHILFLRISLCRTTIKVFVPAPQLTSEMSHFIADKSQPTLIPLKIFLFHHHLYNATRLRNEGGKKCDVIVKKVNAIQVEDFPFFFFKYGINIFFFLY